jgi:pyruvate/2-oxoglutarate dehydrogenase complex dihydrolipoamide acyltransferase (E2) component
MVHEIHIPVLGMNMKQATIVNWFFQDEERVEKDCPIVEIETDKAVHEIVAPAGGFLKIFKDKGKIIPVGGLIAIIGSTLEELREAEGREKALARGMEPGPAPIPSSPAGSIGSIGRIKISGIARKLAEKHEIDLSGIRPSDPGGRISKEDVEKAIAEKERAQTRSPVAPATGATAEILQKIPLQGKKKAMAERLAESLRVMAQMTNWEEVDMSRLLEWRSGGGPASVGEQKGRPTWNDVFVKFMGEALKEYPLLNATLDGEEINVWKEINIAVAVAVGDDLVTPVVRKVGEKSLAQISDELGALVKKARENRLSLEDISGGTISLTNIGALGANPGTPIIQLPHAAVVGFGALEKKAVVVEDVVVIRPMMLLAVTVDHRFITGAVSARFRKCLKALLENPNPASLR